MRWENIRWRDDDPKTAALACVHCGVLIEERFKPQMLNQGQWRPTAKGSGETIGFHLSSLYSPLGWLPWSATVAEFVESKENPLRLKNWVNSVLGETWEERGETVDPDNLLARGERYEAEVPTGVGVLIAALHILGPAFVKSLPERAAALANRREVPVAAEPEPSMPLRRPRGWIDGWRG